MPLSENDRELLKKIILSVKTPEAESTYQDIRSLIETDETVATKMGTIAESLGRPITDEELNVVGATLTMTVEERKKEAAAMIAKIINDNSGVPIAQLIDKILEVAVFVVTPWNWFDKP